MIRFALVAAAALMAAVTTLLAGCSLPVPPDDRLAAADPLICADEKQCAIAWRRADYWVETNSHWKIQIDTAMVIETYDGDQTAVFPSFSVKREPMSEGRERILIAAGCRNLYGCLRGTSPDVYTADFKRYVRSGLDPLPAASPASQASRSGTYFQ